MKNENHIHPIFDQLISRNKRSKFLNQNSAVFWLTGLSGSGKSTIAKGVEKRLFDTGYFSQVLDGDNIRTGINQNLGFSLDDRKENIRRIAEVSKLYLNSGVIVICSFISPTIEIRSFAQEIIGSSDFFEIFINAPLELCENRDVKGLYKKARAGEIKGFTGINSPYEAPNKPGLSIDTSEINIQESVSLLYDYIVQQCKI